MSGKMNSMVFAVFIISLYITGYEQYLIAPPNNDNNEFQPPSIQLQEGSNPNSENDLQPPTNYLHQEIDPIKTTQYKYSDPLLVNVIEDPGLDSNGMPKDGKNHPCYRECKPWEKKTCYYRFHVEWYQSMSKACIDCPYNATHCENPDCVPANGIGRTITVVNRKMPGPAIEVCQNDKVVVDVENSLLASGTTIHWHGLHQKETPYMDGAPFVTQCPIQPESTFRYEFGTPKSGTYFWHSHIGLQRGDGITGVFIIREPKFNSPHRNLYDVDKSEHVLLVTDWINNAAAIDLFTKHYHSLDVPEVPNRPGSLLINGRGKFTVTGRNGTTTMMAPVFEVEKGQRYRFRLINGEFLNCPVELTVDGHNITVIASDGFDLVPITASALVTYAGERYDLILNAFETVDNYWIKIRGLERCVGANIRQVAVLRYKGATADEPATIDWNITRTGLVLNAVNRGEEQNVTVPVSRMRSLQPNDASSKPVPDHKHYISYDMQSNNNTHFNKKPHYSTDKVRPEFWSLTPQLNHISMKLPDRPFLVDRPSSAGFCNESTVPSTCQTEYCQCTHVLNVKQNSVVEIVIIDRGTRDVNHPLHLHGHSFRVIAMSKLGNTTTAEEVKALDDAGSIQRNLDHAPVKDTVTIPDGGYTVIRFVADNPGYWLFHCHIEFHAEIGMALVFKVGEHRNMKPVPKGFPQCGDFKSTKYKFV